jgi:hypothetical protein
LIGHLGFLNQVFNQISLQVAHFNPESVAHFNPDLVAHFNPEYPIFAIIFHFSQKNFSFFFKCSRKV